MNALGAAAAVRKLVAVFLAAFSIYTAFYGVMPDLVQRPLHLACVFALVFLSTSCLGAPSRPAAARLMDAALLALGIGVLLYHVFLYEEIAARWGELTKPEFYMGIVSVVVLLEATRRTIGWPIVILAALFLIYAFVGPYLPGIFTHRGYSLERVISQAYLGTGGIFGTPLGVSATFVIMIVIFGAFLERSGAGKVLMDIAVGATGMARGGPAKAAVVGSSLMGMISGTAVANVLTTGTISIPLMKRSGYKPHVAGAIEAVASTGGQLVPPVMGAAAFIMADMTAKPYLEIAAAAILPGMFYYVVLFGVVHLEAVKRDLPVLGVDDLPDIRATLREGGHLLLSIPVFVYFLIAGYSVMYASFWAVVAAVSLSYLRRATWLTPRKLLAALVAGGEAVIPVAVACATAGIIIGVIALTGLGLKFSSLIVAVSGGHLFPALVLTLIASLILGMGLPTAAAYILVSTLVAPALVDMGVDLLAAHLFVFYGAMLSSITPPVALAAYSAAGLANANPLKIAMTAVTLGSAAFIVPFFFVYNPALIGHGDIAETIRAAAMSFIGGLSIAVATQGWWMTRASILERVVLGAAAFLLMSPHILSDLGGIAVVAAIGGYQWSRVRQRRRAPAK